jgi:hypothetical protein
MALREYLKLTIEFPTSDSAFIGLARTLKLKGVTDEAKQVLLLGFYNEILYLNSRYALTRAGKWGLSPKKCLKLEQPHLLIFPWVKDYCLIWRDLRAKTK